jgi:hypothetical protein
MFFFSFARTFTLIIDYIEDLFDDVSIIEKRDRYTSVSCTAENWIYKKIERDRGRKKKSFFFFFFFLFLEKKPNEDWEKKKDSLFLLLPLHRLSFSDITCSHLIGSSDRLVWIRVITVHIALSTNEKYPVVGFKINSTRGRT